MRSHLNRMCLALVVAGGLGACGGSSKVSTDELEKKAADALEAQVGQRPDISCPDELEAEVGATTRCTLTDTDGTELGTTLTVTSVDGDTVNFDVVVDG